MPETGTVNRPDQPALSSLNMADTSTPDLPRTSAAVAEPTSHDPDARGHFGVFGGRYVPEALMAVIEEVTAAYEKARGDQAFLDELDRLQRHYSGRPSIDDELWLFGH